MITVVLLLLLGCVTVEAITKHILCDTPKLNIVYIRCDESNHPVITIEPCIFNKNGHMNFSLIMIPRINLDRVHAKVEIWKESMKVSYFTYVLCSGVDDEFDFCGGIKGERLVFSTYQRRLSKLPFVKGTYVIKVHLLVGQQEEIFFCMDFTLNIKSNP